MREENENDTDEVQQLEIQEDELREIQNENANYIEETTMLDDNTGIRFAPCEGEAKKIQALRQSINQLLETSSDTLASFEDMLLELGCTLEDYIMAARLQLISRKVYYKRKPNASRINCYSPKTVNNCWNFTNKPLKPTTINTIRFLKTLTRL